MADESASGKVRFSGPALKDGLMDAREFAPAVVGLADLIEDSASALYGDDVRARVLLSSGFRPGSFIADFQVHLNGFMQVSAFAVGVHAMGLTPLVKAIGIHASASFNLLRLMRLLRGRPIPNKLELENGNIEINVEGDNNMVLVVPPEVVTLYESDTVKRSLYAFSRPLQNEGIEQIQFRKGRTVVERIYEQDLIYLEAAAKRLSPSSHEEPTSEDVSESVDVITVDLLQGVFSERESFRFFDGENKFYARITDQGWWRRIHQRLDGYYEGDRMRVRRASRQLVDERGNLHREHEIVEVLDHKHRPGQVDLFDDEE